MIGCDQTVTVVQRVYNSTTDTDSYTKTVVDGVSWHGKTKIEIQDKGIKSADIITIRIPENVMPQGLVIADGDFIVKGSVTVQINSQKDLKNYEYITVISVGDNRRGRLKHWAVTGK